MLVLETKFWEFESPLGHQFLNTTMNNRCIVMQYPPMAGGKFVAHCLSMSPHVIPLGEYQLVKKFVYSDCVQSRLQYVLSTLPPDKSQLKNWRQFEAKRYTRDWCMPAAAIDSNKFYFFITHLAIDSAVDHVISLTNSSKFRALSALVGKHSYYATNYAFIKEEGWPDYPLTLEDITEYILNKLAENITFPESFQGNMLLNVDSTIFNKKEFLSNIEIFADTIGIIKLDIAAVEQVYDTYMQLHK